MRTPTTPGIAAFLSFVLPGLGQIAVGAVRRGLLLLIPLAVLGILAILLSGAGLTELVELALSPEFLIAFLIGNLLFAAWHVFAIVDAERMAVAMEPAPRRPHRAATVALIAMVVATIGLHGAVEVVGYQYYATLDAVFAQPGEEEGWAIPEASFEPDPTPVPTPVPTPTPTTRARHRPRRRPRRPCQRPPRRPSRSGRKDGRLNLLLIGSDAGPDRWSLRTDTMIVLSVDEATGRAALFGIPRNMSACRCRPRARARRRTAASPGSSTRCTSTRWATRSTFPGGDARGMRAVSGAVQELVGVRLDGMVVVNLGGFVHARRRARRPLDRRSRAPGRQQLPARGWGRAGPDRHQGGLPEASTGGWPSPTPARATRTPTTAGCGASSTCWSLWPTSSIRWSCCPRCRPCSRSPATTCGRPSGARTCGAGGHGSPGRSRRGRDGHLHATELPLAHDHGVDQADPEGGPQRVRWSRTQTHALPERDGAARGYLPGLTAPSPTGIPLRAEGHWPRARPVLHRAAVGDLLLGVAHGITGGPRWTHSAS